MRINPVAYKYSTISNHKKQNNNMAFSSNYGNLLKEATFAEISIASEAEKLCVELIKSIDASPLIKTEDFAFINGMINKYGLREFLSGLKASFSDIDYEKFIRKITEKPMMIAKSERKPVMELSSPRPNGIINSIFTGLFNKSGMNLLFSGETKADTASIEFYLNKKGDLGVRQVVAGSHISNEFFKESGAISMRSTTYMGFHPSIIYYKKDGSEANLKNWLCGK